MTGIGVLGRWLLGADLRRSPGRNLAALGSVAVGVGLGLSIHQINTSALDAFQRSLNVVNGHADLSVTAVQGRLPVDRLQAVAAVPGVAAVSPVLDLKIQVDGAAADGVLRLIGLDVFSAARMTPDLMPAAAAGGSLAVFEPDAVFLSQAARSIVPAATPDLLRLRGPDGTVRPLRVRGDLPGVVDGTAVAVMDIGSAQWAFGIGDALDRIDLRLQETQSAPAVAQALRAALGPGVVVALPEQGEQRMSNLSRAYRVNLQVLALVALLTGAFIVRSTMTLAAARRAPEMSLLRVLGAPAAQSSRLLLQHGLLLGVAGSAIGVLLGTLLSLVLLATVGANLGGGNFGSSSGLSQARLVADPPAMLGFALLGVAAALAGALAPARAARRSALARTLRAGNAERGLRQLRRPLLPPLLALAALPLLALPAVQGIPVFAYLAIACLLFAGVGMLPQLLSAALALLFRGAAGALWRQPVAWLAATRLRQSPATVSAALAGVVAAFALATAMIVMVHSFRTSVDDWLSQVLPADLYARAADAQPFTLEPAVVQALGAIPGVARVGLQRVSSVQADPAQPPIALIARDFDAALPMDRQLPLTGPSSSFGPGTNTAPGGPQAIDAWVSEATTSRYGFLPGTVQHIALGTQTVALRIRGVWRDFARQTGAIVIDRNDYRRLSGDASITDLALSLRHGGAEGDRGVEGARGANGARGPGGTDRAAVIEAARALAPVLATLPFHAVGQIRAQSLRIFDQSFAVTYLLEVVALVVGLFGVATTFATDSLNRLREFGMTRSLGLSARSLLAMLAVEAGLGTALALGLGSALGLAIGWVLVHHVNPQSFHWTMGFQVPWGLMAASALVLWLTAVLTAMLAARAATRRGPLQALRAGT